MLQNPNWDRPQKTEADICLADFIEWLETKDPGEKYDFSDLSACAVAQYGATRGIKPATGRYTETVGRILGRSDASQIYVLNYANPTFGETLKRAKELQGERK